LAPTREEFKTKVYSAMDMFQVVSSMSGRLTNAALEREFGNSSSEITGPYKAILSKFLGDFFLYMYALTNNWTSARSEAQYPTIFASGDRMTIVGYLLMRHFMKTSLVRKTLNFQIRRAGDVLKPAALVLSKDSVVFEDATVLGIHEFSERRRGV
jgi:hypothetical protein